MLTSREIRSRFIEFFEQEGHTLVPSSSLVPSGDDASLLFHERFTPGRCWRPACGGAGTPKTSWEDPAGGLVMIRAPPPARQLRPLTC